MSDLKFNVLARSETSARTVVEARHFKMIVDEPESLGGSDLGANPVEYVLAAFAGCLNVVGHLIARELDFTLKGLEIEIEGDLNPDRLMGVPTEDRAGYKSIRVKISPDSDADKELLSRWLKIVKERCPVSDNLSNPTPVSIELK